MQRDLAHEHALSSFSIRWGKELALFFIFYVYVVQKRILKNRLIHHCSVTAGHLDCANSEKEYLKTNLPYWSSYMPMHVGGGQGYRAVYFTDRAPSTAQRQAVLGS